MARLLGHASTHDHSLELEVDTIQIALGKIFPLLALVLGKTGRSSRLEVGAVAEPLLRMGL
jgi:hypothetical protein